jgi:alcohol dehydrogenase (cytochrome c)
MEAYRPRWTTAAAVAAALLATGGATAAAEPVTGQDLLAAQGNAGEWLMYGRNYLNQRFSPLAELTPANVGELTPVFAYSTGGKLAGFEATPLFHDGTLYFTGDYSRVFALDARTGTLKWLWEPKYEDGIESVLCCGPVNRGLAIHGDKVYVGTLDARLVALNVKDGSVAWERTLEDWKAAYTSTGAPLVVGDLVVTGIGGAEFGVRGFVQAFKAETGEPAWKTFVIPGPGEPGNETWPGETWGRPGARRPGRRAPTTPRRARCSGARATPAPGTPTRARATTSGAAPWWRSTPRAARSSGVSSTRPTTPGTTTATTAQHSSTSPSTVSRARWRCSRTATGSSTRSTG